MVHLNEVFLFFYFFHTRDMIFKAPYLLVKPLKDVPFYTVCTFVLLYYGKQCIRT